MVGNIAALGVNTFQWSERGIIILTASAMPAVPPAMMCVAKPTVCLSLALDAMEEVEVQGIRNEECGVDHGAPGWFHMAGLSVPDTKGHI